MDAAKGLEPSGCPRPPIVFLFSLTSAVTLFAIVDDKDVMEFCILETLARWQKINLQSLQRILDVSTFADFGLSMVAQAFKNERQCRQ